MMVNSIDCEAVVGCATGKDVHDRLRRGGAAEPIEGRVSGLRQRTPAEGGRRLPI